MYVKMPNDTTTAVQHPPKAHLGLPTTSWLRPSSFDKHSCPYVGQWSSPTHPGHFHHDLISTTFTDLNNDCSAAASSPMHLQANHAHQASPLQLRMQLAETQTTHGTCISEQKSPVKRKHQPRTCSVHTQASAMNRQLWLRQVLSAPGAERLSDKKKLGIRNFDKTEYQQFKIRDPPQTTIPGMIKNAAHTAVRVPASDPSSAAALRALFAARLSRHQTRATPAPRCSPPPPALPRPP